MPAHPKPFVHGAWYWTKAGGQRVKLCRASDGPDVAASVLASLVGDADTPDTPRVAVPTVADVVSLYLTHAVVYYRRSDGTPTPEVASLRLAFRELLRRAGPLPIPALTKRLLKSVRDDMVTAGLSRKVVNKRFSLVARGLKWLAEEDHAPAVLVAEAATIRPLAAHRTAAPERPAVAAVDFARVFAVYRLLAEPWATILQFQWETGARPAEVCGLRASQITGVPGHRLEADLGTAHKTGHRGHRRVIAVPESASMRLTPWIHAALATGRDPLFVTMHTLATGVLRRSYSQAVARACRAAGVAHWHPHQVRHAFGTRVRERFGLDAAQALLGHARASATEIYAEVGDRQRRHWHDRL